MTLKGCVPADDKNFDSFCETRFQCDHMLKNFKAHDEGVSEVSEWVSEPVKMCIEQASNAGVEK